MSLYSHIFSTPLGELRAIVDGNALIVLEFMDTSRMKEQYTGVQENNNNPLLQKVRNELEEYFLGTRKNFTIPLAPAGTEFQKQAWKALEKIPYGETRSYKDEAILAGNPKAIRAIGGANNKNPIVIIIPCHRVIGADGRLVGYGGGIERKKWLLEFEKSHRV